MAYKIPYIPQMDRWIVRSGLGAIKKIPHVKYELETIV